MSSAALLIGQESRDALGIVAAVQLRPLRPPLEIDAAREVPTALLLVVFVLVAIGVWLFFRWMRARRMALTPAAVAERELQRLIGMRLVEQGRLKEHYEILSGCLRRYAAAEYRLPALALTPRELAGEVAPAPQDPRFVDYLGSVLMMGDLVRFDHTTRTVEQARSDVMSALDMVRRRPPAPATGRGGDVRSASIDVEREQPASPGTRNHGRHK
jgi:hypothetical protein